MCMCMCVYVYVRVCVCVLLPITVTPSPYLPQQFLPSPPSASHLVLPLHCSDVEGWSSCCSAFIQSVNVEQGRAVVLPSFSWLTWSKD